MALFRRSSSFVFPGPRDRVAVFGATGSGKSVFTIWLFSECADFDRKPWVFVDFKGDDLINDMIRLELAKVVSVEKDPPKEAGIYVIKPSPHEVDKVAGWIWKVWEGGKLGLIFDELYMVPEFKGQAGTGGPLKSILTQGRSKEIPVWGLAQRPVDINLHMITEAQYIAEFYLKRREDRQRVRSYIPDDEPVFSHDRRVAQYNCRWYDDKRNVALILGAAPTPDAILDTIAHRVHAMSQRRTI
jgi:hypothetical protein